MAICKGGCPEITRNIVTNTGGFYELLYYRLANGEPFDVADNLTHVMKPVAARLGARLAEATRLFKGCTRSIEASRTLEID
ncbi:MAG: hypothetical protein J6S36_01640 [Eggerthellaceae bacterium]|nr:hypothetical protein [Eggerthellaceae bacterium]